VGRPGPNPGDESKNLIVDWEAVLRDGATVTNYKLLPGDRIYAKKKPVDPARP